MGRLLLLEIISLILHILMKDISHLALYFFESNKAQPLQLFFSHWTNAVLGKGDMFMHSVCVAKT